MKEEKDVCSMCNRPICFRVGKFLQLTQGTGPQNIPLSIALSNLDGIGFKRGVVVAEFSSDTAMTDNSSDMAAPTESAVRGYVNRRLHFDHPRAISWQICNRCWCCGKRWSHLSADNIPAGGFKIKLTRSQWTPRWQQNPMLTRQIMTQTN